MLNAIILSDFDLTQPWYGGGPYGTYGGIPFSDRGYFLKYGLIAGFRFWISSRITGYVNAFFSKIFAPLIFPLFLVGLNF